MPAHGACVHLSFEERRRSLNERLQRQRHLGGGGRPEPADLPEEPQQLRLSCGQAEHGAHHRLDAIPPPPGPGQRRLEGFGQVLSAPGDDRLE